MEENRIFIVDDDGAVRQSLRVLLEASGFSVSDFSSGGVFLDNYASSWRGCVISDVAMPEMGGLELQAEMKNRSVNLPLIMITGHGDVTLAVEAMKMGALDFIEKPLDRDTLLKSVACAFSMVEATRSRDTYAQSAIERVKKLTPRELEVLEHLLLGQQSKVIAHRLDISPRTVEVHRARLMKKMLANTLSDLVRLAIAANVEPAEA